MEEIDIEVNCHVIFSLKDLATITVVQYLFQYVKSLSS